MFYVYAHIDPLSNKVRYIGKGKDRRAWSLSHRKGYHKNWLAKLNKLGLKPIIEILADNLTEEQAFEKEKELIKSYDDLTNLTSGGEGVSGFKPSEEFRQWIKVFNTGKKQTPETVAKMVAARKGKPRSESAKKKISMARKGIKFSEEHKRKLSEARRNRVVK